jgi:TRAP transporter T-component
MNHFSVSTTLLVCVLLVSLVSVGCTSKAEEPPASFDGSGNPLDLIREADQLYKERENVAQVRVALTRLRHAHGLDPANYEAAWKLARVCYVLGMHTDDKAERDRSFETGIDAGRAAVKIEDGKPDGHFWLAANLGGRAEHSVMSGMSDLGDIQEHMEAVLKLDEGYEAGSAYMALGSVELKTPRLVGGDPKKAIDLLEKGLKFGAGNSMLRLRLAEAYLATNNKVAAREQLDFIFKMKPDPNYLPEYNDSVADAKKLQQERF